MTVIIYTNLYIPFDWFVENLSGPVFTDKSHPSKVYGPTWSFRKMMDDDFQIFSIGEFEKEEDAILFKLRWS